MTEDIRRKTSQRIKEVRKKLGLTQEQLAAEADIDYKYLQRIEGKNPPDMGIELIGKLAKALKISPGKLLDLK